MATLAVPLLPVVLEWASGVTRYQVGSRLRLERVILSSRSVVFLGQLVSIVNSRNLLLVLHAFFKVRVCLGWRLLFFPARRRLQISLLLDFLRSEWLTFDALQLILALSNRLKHRWGLELLIGWRYPIFQQFFFLLTCDTSLCQSIGGSRLPVGVQRRPILGRDSIVLVLEELRLFEVTSVDLRDHRMFTPMTWWLLEGSFSSGRDVLWLDTRVKSWH